MRKKQQAEPNAPGSDGMALSVAFDIVLFLANAGNKDFPSLKHDEAIELIRALGVGSFNLQE